MRVLQTVTLISPDGAYGGPARVAFNQSAALVAAGAVVEVCGGTRGYAEVPHELYGIPVRLFPVRRVLPRTGFAGLTAPGLIIWFLRNARRYDVVHVHLARDLVTAVIAGLAVLLRVDLHVQTHGMIDHTDKLLAKPLDALLIRPILRRAASVFYLTERELGDLLEIEPTARLIELPNGVPAVSGVQPALLGGGVRGPETAAPVIDPLRVLYVARLQERKRPEVLVEAAIALLDDGFHGDFTFVGPDEGSGPRVSAMISSSGYPDRICWLGPADPSEVLSHMQKADLYVLPSVDEPFPMSVLEAMAAGLPVIITDTCGLASAIRAGDAGTVIDRSTTALVAAIRDYGDDRERLFRHRENAVALVNAEFAMGEIASRLLDRYGAVPVGAEPSPVEDGYERVEWLDVAFAGGHVLVAFGPHDLPSAAVVAGDFERLARTEAGSRLHLVPDPTTRRWRRRPTPQVSILDTIPQPYTARWNAAADGAGRLMIFAEIAATTQTPVTVLLGGRYTYVRVDHGLGDATLDYDILRAVGTGYPSVGEHTRADQGGDRAARNAPTLYHLLGTASSVRELTAGLPVVWAEATSVLPRLSRLLIQQVMRRPRRSQRGPVTAVGPTATGELAIVGHICGQETTDAVNSLGPGLPSKNSVFCAGLVHGFEAAGIRLAPMITLLVDLRRYLGANAALAGNMSSVIAIGRAHATTPADFGAAMRASLQARAPVIRAAAASVRVMLRARRASVDSPPVDDAIDDAIALVISNVAAHPGAAQIWDRASDGDRGMYVAAPPRHGRQVSVFVTAAGGRYILTAAFRGDVIESRQVHEALCEAERRIREWCAEGR
ncbi:MAG: glycosyltransferase [Gordonia sp. (in: high G+C Gram-positive bacteria)]